MRSIASSILVKIAYYVNWHVVDFSSFCLFILRLRTHIMPRLRWVGFHIETENKTVSMENFSSELRCFCLLLLLMYKYSCKAQKHQISLKPFRTYFKLIYGEYSTPLIHKSCFFNLSVHGIISSENAHELLYLSVSNFLKVSFENIFKIIYSRGNVCFPAFMN